MVPSEDGGWRYELDNDSPLVQGLDEGQTATETWKIVGPGGVGYISVDVTINGTADKPEITYETDNNTPQNDTILLGEAQEDVTTSISGLLGVDDADLGDTHQWAIDGNPTGSYGTLSIDSDTGEWTYTLDPGVELPAGKEVFDTFFVTVTDTDPNEDPSTASDRREVKVKIVGSAEDVDNPNPGDAKIIVETFSADEDNGDQNETGVGPSTVTITSDDVGALQLDPSLGLGDQISWTLVDGSGTYGNIKVNQDGTWEFTLDNDSQAVQSLQEGETRQDVFEVYAVDQYGKTIVDDNGLPQTLEIVVNVHGQNDAPTLQANVEETIVADDPDQRISGRLTVNDVDVEDRGQHTWSIAESNVNSDYGTLTFNANGVWSFKVDPTNPEIIALAANESIEQTWTVTVTDPKGETATQTLTINIQGDNQAPTMTTDNGSVTEDVFSGAEVSVTKQIHLDDVDTNDVVTLDPVNLNGTYGNFVVDPSTNTWKYVLFNDKPHVQSLGEGVTVTEEFTIRATDQFGAEVTQKVEVSVVGSNDQPTVSGSASGSVSDALGSTAAGKVTVSDVDVGDTHTFSVKQDSNLGTFTVDNNGNWKFVVDENNPEINALAKGQTKTIQVSVVATDSSGVTATEESNEHVINITIVGTNDAPQIVDIGEQMATENTTTQLAGNFDSGDVDTVNVADSHHWQVVSGDPRGELTVDPVTGAWTFNLTGDFEYLSEGETLSSPLSYQVKVTDEHGASDTITVNFQVTGTNDAPTIVAANTVATGTVHEDPAGAESGTANGVVTIADVDHNDTHSYSLSNSGMVTEIQGTYGTLKLIAGDTPESVKWEYVLDQDKANSLNDGPVTENFDLFIESLVGGVAQGDAIKQTIEVTVEGRNDAAIVAPESQTHAETDAPLQMSGNLNSTDVDNPDDTFTVQNNKQGTYGTFSIDANGEWTFVANQAFNSLNVGQSVEETFAVTTIDGTPTSMTVKIEGTNDAATVSVGSVERDETDAPLTITDTLTSSDVDNADNTFTPSSKVGTYGTFSIDANGVWTFVAKESFDHLNVGQSVSETFDVTSVDGTPSTVTVKINGTNDAADISAATENLTESNSILTANGTLTADDPDNANNVFVAQNGTVGNLGTFTLTAAGVWTFTAKSNFDNLAEGQKAEESFTVTSIDGTTSEVKIVITGTNDAATVSSADVTLQETDAVLSTSGTLTSLDIDNPDNKFQEQTNVAGNHGTFSIDADGNWTYIADESFNSLNVGQSVDDTFNVKSVDGTVSTVKVTIQGTNDAPSITGDFAKGVQEGVTDSVSGTVNITDVDSASVTRSLRNGTLSGDTFTATGQYGTLTFNVATGVWAYVLLTGSSNALTGDQTATETFYIEATDGAPGGDSVQPITITVTGNKGQIGDSSLDDILTATSDDEWLFGNSIPIGGGTSVDTDSQDTFRWETASLAGTDTIKDFDVRDFAATDPTVKHDVVDLTSVDFKADQQLTDQLSVSEQSGDTVIEISDSGAVLQSIVLEGVTLTSLLGVSQQEVDSMTPTEVLLALHQSEQLTLPDQIRIGTGASETLIGTDESDIIYGGGGNDILTGESIPIEK
ncbi:hypothetical protein F0243_25870 [Vibrio mediterranei]|nr:hypothetical protein [Vibrio mediterranei]